MSTSIHMVLDIHGFRSSVAMATNTMFSRLNTHLWFKSEGKEALSRHLPEWRGGAVPPSENSINIKELNQSSLGSSGTQLLLKPVQAEGQPKALWEATLCTVVSA